MNHLFPILPELIGTRSRILPLDPQNRPDCGTPRALPDRPHIEPDLRAIFVEPRRYIYISLEIDHRPDRAIVGNLREREIRDPFDCGAVFEPNHQRTFTHYRIRSLRATHQRRPKRS